MTTTKVPVFPSTKQVNLQRREISFPEVFKEYSRCVVFLVFLREQQQTVNTWRPWLTDIMTKQPTTNFFILPVVDDCHWIAKKVAVEGIRLAVTDDLSRERLVMMFVDKQKLISDLGFIMTESHPHCLVVDSDANILDFEIGEFTEEKGLKLSSAVLVAD